MLRIGVKQLNRKGIFQQRFAHKRTIKDLFSLPHSVPPILAKWKPGVFSDQNQSGFAGKITKDLPSNWKGTPIKKPSDWVSWVAQAKKQVKQLVEQIGQDSTAGKPLPEVQTPSKQLINY